MAIAAAGMASVSAPPNLDRGDQWRIEQLTKRRDGFKEELARSSGRVSVEDTVKKTATWAAGIGVVVGALGTLSEAFDDFGVGGKIGAVGLNAATFAVVGAGLGAWGASAHNKTIDKWEHELKVAQQEIDFLTAGTAEAPAS